MIPYGKMFRVGEVILVYIENEPVFFARVEKIEPDHKKNWWQMSFLILTVPLKSMTWILDDEQMRGQPFTMNSIPMQIKKVESPDADFRDPETRVAEESERKESGGNIISMFEED
ncbi:hypothetical protein JXA02_06975 [candidate division KSB1 bacterium]|nr:hypothetical protein [candidate division KSB1 bacterium]RQW06766.1 MAG: hypothetical protein EH222_08110 [candidate division KSB1 bacterium]